MHKIDFTIQLTLSQYTQLRLIQVVPAMSLLILYSLTNQISLCSFPIPLSPPIIFPVPLNCHYPQRRRLFWRILQSNNSTFQSLILQNARRQTNHTF